MAPHNDNLIATAAIRRRRKWFKRKRRVWPKYALLALFLAVCFAVIVYVIGQNLALVDQ